MLCAATRRSTPLPERRAWRTVTLMSAATCLQVCKNMLLSLRTRHTHLASDLVLTLPTLLLQRCACQRVARVCILPWIAAPSGEVNRNERSFIAIACVIRVLLFFDVVLLVCWLFCIATLQIKGLPATKLYFSVVKKLLIAGADVKLVNDNGETVHLWQNCRFCFSFKH